MSDPVRIEPERLLAQTAWVRRLALSLSRDESSADDLAQEALAMALRKPPSAAQSEGALRAWFAAVTRNLAIHRARGDSRRDRREREVARPELERSQDRLRELEELRSELVKHVLTLPELSQQVVLLHFFEELDSAEIARRLGVPDSTVCNRLRRALAELREKIERKHGSDWRNLCLFALPPTGAKLAAGSGSLAAVFVMGNGWMLVGALVLLAGSSWFALGSSNAGLPARLELDSPALSPTAALETPLSSSSPAAARENMQPSAAGLAAATLYCQGEVRSTDGTRIEQAVIIVRDAGLAEVARQERVRGWFALSGLAPGHYTLEAAADLFRKRSVEFELSGSENPARVDVVMQPTLLLQVRIVDAQGQPLGRDASGRKLEREQGVCAVATRSKPRAQLPPSPSEYVWFEMGHWFSQAASGHVADPLLAAGSTGALELFEDLPCYVSLVVRGAVQESRLVTRVDERIDFRLEDSALVTAKASARMRFVDAQSGAPLAGLGVELGPAWRTGVQKSTDARGEVTFEDEPLIPIALVYRGIRRPIQLRPGENELGTIAVPALRKLHVRIVDEAGQSIAGEGSWIALDSSFGPQSFDSYQQWRVAAGGTAEIDALACRLRVCAYPNSSQDWTSIGTLVEAGTEPLEVVLHAQRGVEVDLACPGEGTADRSLVFIAPDGAACLRVYSREGSTTRQRLAPGEYEVELWEGERRLSKRKVQVTPETRRLEFGP